MNEPLRLEQAIEELQRIHHQAGSRRSSMVLHLPVTQPGAVGGTPGTGVIRIGAGFDWDASKVMLQPQQPLTLLSPEDVAAVHESVLKGQSWHAYQAQKKHYERIRALEIELAALKANHP